MYICIHTSSLVRHNARINTLSVGVLRCTGELYATAYARCFLSLTHDLTRHVTLHYRLLSHGGMCGTM
jgi:hypothetical protein